MPEEEGVRESLCLRKMGEGWQPCLCLRKMAIIRCERMGVNSDVALKRFSSG